VGDEWDAGEVRVKRLATGEEVTMQIEEVGAWLHR
jgi:hypothetical protein